jgi:hypothetical protein
MAACESTISWTASGRREIPCGRERSGDLDAYSDYLIGVVLTILERHCRTVRWSCNQRHSSHITRLRSPTTILGGDHDDLQNRTLTVPDEGKTPYELFHSVKPDRAHIRTFSCVVKAALPSEVLEKLDDQAYSTVRIGFGSSDGCLGE